MNNLDEIYDYAKKENIPIMLDEGISFLCDFIKENNIKRILEIGTAIGFSAIKMASVNNDIKVTTIERDVERFNIAKENVKKEQLENRIKLINSDTLEVNLEDKFDLIFIDAAKGKNIDFFEKFKINLKKNGYIITDNLKFHGYVDKDIKDIDSRNIRGLVRKIRKYIDFLNNNKEFETKFYSFGDGDQYQKKYYSYNENVKLT